MISVCKLLRDYDAERFERRLMSSAETKTEYEID